MAEVAEVEVNGEVRTIKDITARNGVAANATAIADNAAAITQAQTDIETNTAAITQINEYPKVFFVAGVIGNSDGGTLKIVGGATISLYNNHTCRIDISGKVTATGTNPNLYLAGINRDLIKRLNTNIPTITPIHGGTMLLLTPSTNNAMIDVTSQDYGAVLQHNGQYWIFSRIYNENGSVGGLSETLWPLNTRIIATLYGTW